MEPMLGLGLEVLFIGHGKVAAPGLSVVAHEQWPLPSTLFYLRRCVFNQQTVYSSAAAPLEMPDLLSFTAWGEYFQHVEHNPSLKP